MPGHFVKDKRRTASRRSFLKQPSLPLERQEELFEVIRAVFESELASGNCILLSQVGSRAKAVLNEHGFPQTGRALFDSAPKYFKVGYDQKNAACIALAGYPDDPAFTLSHSPTSPPAAKALSRSPFPLATQQLLESLVKSTFFVQLEKNNCLQLSDVGKKLNREFQKRGLGNANKQTFLRAPQFFLVGKDKKGADCIALRKCALGTGFIPQPGSLPAPDAESRLYQQLLNAFPTLDVPAAKVKQFMENKQIALPPDKESFEQLYDALCENFGSTTRRNGEGTPEERFLVLRYPDPIPPDVSETVRRVITQFFQEDMVVSNKELGRILRKNGIDFQAYNYPDLTGFLRSFPHLLSIVSQTDPDTGRARINVRILKRSEDPETSSWIEQQKRLLAEERFAEVLKPSVVRNAVQLNDPELWNLLFCAAAHTDGLESAQGWQLSEWERLVITFGHAFTDAVADDKTLERFGFQEAQRQTIREFFSTYPDKKTFVSIAARLQGLCGEERGPSLALYCYHLGFLGGATIDRGRCFRRYLNVQAERSIPLFRAAWDQHKDDCISNTTIKSLVYRLLTPPRFEALSYILSHRPERLTRTQELDVYQSYVEAALAPDSGYVPAPMDGMNDTQRLQLVKVYLHAMEAQGQIAACLRLLCCCQSQPERFIPVSLAVNALSDGFLSRNWPEAVRLAAEGGEQEFFTVCYLLRAGFAEDVGGIWEAYCQDLKQRLAAKLQSASEAEKPGLFRQAAFYFPEDPFFSDAFYEAARSAADRASTEGLKSLCRELYTNGSYAVLVRLYQEYHVPVSEPWLLELVSQSCQRFGDHDLAIQTAYREISARRNLEVLPGPAVRRLFGLLQESARRGELPPPIPEDTPGVLEACVQFPCEYADAQMYLLAVMGLAAVSEHAGLCSLFNALSPKQDRDAFPAYFKRISAAMQDFGTGYRERAQDLTRTYEYLLTAESIEMIEFCLQAAANYLQYDGFDRDYDKYWGTSVDSASSTSMTKLLIAGYQQERSWRLHSKYSNDLHKSALNYTVNLFWMLKFKATPHPLANCIRSLEEWSSGSMPRNLLVNNLHLLRGGLHLDVYWQAFHKHLLKNGNFKNASAEIIEGYLTALFAYSQPTGTICEILTTILAQSRAFELFCRLFLAQGEAIEQVLPGSPGRLIRFLALFASEREFNLGEAFHSRLRALRKQVQMQDLSDRNRAALLWVDQLLSRRTGDPDSEVFFRASGALLENFPMEPADSLVNMVVLPKDSSAPLDYELVRCWLCTFGTPRVLPVTYNYLRRRTLPDDPGQRLKACQLLFLVVRDLIIHFDKQRMYPPNAYLSLCRSYYALRTLAQETNPESVSFQQKLESRFLDPQDAAALKRYREAQDTFLHSGIDPEFLKNALYCGTSNYWDIFLQRFLERLAEYKDYAAPFVKYLKELDWRPLHRRLLQMYAYPRAAGLQAGGSASKWVNRMTYKEVRQTRQAIEHGIIHLEVYVPALQDMVDRLCPAIGTLIRTAESQTSPTDQSDWVSAFIFVVQNKKGKNFAEKLAKANLPLLHEAVLPALVAIQSPETLRQIAEQLVYRPSPAAPEFLSDPGIQSALGSFLIGFYRATYAARCGEYETAAGHLAAAGECPPEMDAVYRQLSAKIEAREEVGSPFQNPDNLSRMPAFSFLKSNDPKGVPAAQLATEFYSESGLHDAGSRCALARKLFYWVKDGYTVNDLPDFLYRWGFCEIDNEPNTERRAALLFELLDHLRILPDRQLKLFKRRFVQQFTGILNEYPFHLLSGELKNICAHYDLLYATFQPFEDCQCYAELLSTLSELDGLGADAVPQLEAVQRKLLATHANYSRNYFADRCLEFVGQHIHQIYSHGVFEVRILNKSFNGTVFYQVKNIGFQKVSDLTIVLYLRGRQQETITRVTVADELPGGLRPGQSYAGEYKPGIPLAAGEKVHCILQLQYGNYDYIAVGTSPEDALVMQEEPYEYHRARYAGYLETTIGADDPDNFIGRQSELDKVCDSLANRQNVLLYGTNGTGKSSLLNKLIDEHNIPALCKQYRRIPVILRFVSDDNCTERQVVGDLIGRICGKSSALLQSLRHICRSHPEIDRSRLEESLADVAALKEELTTVDENGIHSMNVIELFSGVAQALSEVGLQLFLLWDNFEKVIASRNINPGHMRFLRTIVETSSAASGIRFLFSGSNYLLEAVSIRQGSDSWSEILSRCANPVKVGNLCREDFHSLLTQPRALNDGELSYTEEAVEYLWQYTGGHAFYSCLLGNRTLAILSRRKVHRRYIYPSDLFNAIYHSARYLQTDGSDTSKENAIEKQIFQDISDNTAVKYVGKLLAQEIAQGAGRVSHNELQKKVLYTRPDIGNTDFRNALDILYARDFIRRTRTEDPGEQQAEGRYAYSFTSDLYLERFLNIPVPELSQEMAQEITSQKEEVKELFSRFILKASSDEIVWARSIFGSNFSGGTFFAPGAQQTNHIQVNILNIMNTLRGIISQDADEETVSRGLRALPRLDAYIGTDERLPSPEDVESTDQEDEALTESTDRLTADYRAALAGSPSDEGFAAWETLGIEHGDYCLLSETLDPSFLVDLYFAARLDAIFALAGEGPVSGVDYSPVSIMYCKVIEKMLKFYHTSLYCIRLPNTSTQIKYKGKKVPFGELTDPDIQKAVQDRIMLGAFLYPLTPKFVQDETLEALAKSRREEKTSPWRKHGETLDRVRQIRNQSAHGKRGDIVTREMLRELKQLLFKQEGLLRIVQLCGTDAAARNPGPRSCGHVQP